MRESIKQLVKICAETLPVYEPIYEFDSLQVQDQVGFADLRPLFPGKKYIGADMRNGPGVDVILNLHKIDLPSESVGTVLILETLEHVEFPRKAIEEAHRILKPNGILIISSVMNFPIHDYPHDYWRFTPEGFKSLLKSFAYSFVDFAGDKKFPRTAVGIASKNSIPEDSLDDFKKKFADWKKYWSHYKEKPWKRLAKLLVRSKSIKTIYRKCFPSFTDYLKKELLDCESVLDLGCGYDSLIQYCSVPFSVGVDLFNPYLEESKRRNIHNKYIKDDIRKVNFESKSFDAVLATEVLEHLTREEGYQLIAKLEKWAKKKIIISTPNGYIWQEDYDQNPFQEHKTGWSADELKKIGFKVYGMKGWKRLRGYKMAIKYKPTLLWKIISDFTQKITYYYPEYAFQLFAVKEIENKNE